MYTYIYISSVDLTRCRRRRRHRAATFQRDERTE